MKTLKDALFVIAAFAALFFQASLIDYLYPSSNITGTAGGLIAFVSFGLAGYASLLFPAILFIWLIDWKICDKFQGYLIWGIIGIVLLSVLIRSHHPDSYLIIHRFFPSGFLGNLISSKLESVIGFYPTKLFSAIIFLFCLYQFRYSILLSRIFDKVILKIKRNKNDTGVSVASLDGAFPGAYMSDKSDTFVSTEKDFGFAAEKNKKEEVSYEIVNKKKPATNRSERQDDVSEADKLEKDGKQKGYLFPVNDFLNKSGATIVIDEEKLKKKADILTDKLKRFGIDGRVMSIHPGPVITMFEYKPASTVKISKISNLADDLAMAMRALSVRIVAPIPGKGVIGIEVSNQKRELVYLSDIIESSEFKDSDSPLTIALGKDTEGYIVVADLAKMPHLLIAGSTGSGKSVGLNAMITSILYKATPEDVRFLMIDPKVLELSVYDGIPHMLAPVITDPNMAQVALAGMVRKMDYRYAIMAKKGVKNIISYNEMVSDKEKLPFLVVVIDELADLMMVSTKKVEMAIARLAQMARAAGIHLLVATQRPSVDVLTGLIKANFPARIAFKVASKIDSRTIIDTSGAEKLLGKGDMLFLAPGTSAPQRVHGAYISEHETAKVAEFLRKNGAPVYDESLMRIIESDQSEQENNNGFVSYDSENNEDDEYQKAIDTVLQDKKTSISYLQRKLRIGYNKSARYIEQMEKDGIISAPDLHGRREILFKRK